MRCRRHVTVASSIVSALNWRNYASRESRNSSWSHLIKQIFIGLSPRSLEFQGLFRWVIVHSDHIDTQTFRFRLGVYFFFSCFYCWMGLSDFTFISIYIYIWMRCSRYNKDSQEGSSANLFSTMREKARVSSSSTLEVIIEQRTVKSDGINHEKETSFRCIWSMTFQSLRAWPSLSVFMRSTSSRLSLYISSPFKRCLCTIDDA